MQACVLRSREAARSWAATDSARKGASRRQRGGDAPGKVRTKAYIGVTLDGQARIRDRSSRARGPHYLSFHRVVTRHEGRP